MIGTIACGDYDCCTWEYDICSCWPLLLPKLPAMHFPIFGTGSGINLVMDNTITKLTPFQHLYYETFRIIRKKDEQVVNEFRALMLSSFPLVCNLVTVLDALSIFMKMKVYLKMPLTFYALPSLFLFVLMFVHSFRKHNLIEKQYQTFSKSKLLRLRWLFIIYVSLSVVGAAIISTYMLNVKDY
jgi:hypothetical protein